MDRQADLQADLQTGAHREGNQGLGGNHLVEDHNHRGCSKVGIVDAVVGSLEEVVELDSAVAEALGMMLLVSRNSVRKFECQLVRARNLGASNTKGARQ